MGGYQKMDAHGWVSQSESLFSIVPLQVHLRCRLVGLPIVSGAGDNAILAGLAFVPLVVLLTIAFQPSGVCFLLAPLFGAVFKLGYGGATSASAVSVCSCKFLAAVGSRANSLCVAVVIVRAVRAAVAVG